MSDRETNKQHSRKTCNMKNVTIFGGNYKVSESVYNVLESVKHSQKCLELVFVVGKQSGDIIPA